MDTYLNQLLADIKEAAENLSWPFAEKELNLHDWITDEEEDRTAPVRQLEDWTGISKEMLPPHEKLSDEQVQEHLRSLKILLDSCNCCYVLQMEVPERIQYSDIRDNFDQEVKLKRWHMGFFEHCRSGTGHGKCSLEEYCQCAFYSELFKDMIDEEMSPEQERAMMLEIELKHIKRKYGDDWMKYYPYHLDPEYDDEKGNPYDYGFGDEEDDDEKDDWWRY